MTREVGYSGKSGHYRRDLTPPEEEDVARVEPAVEEARAEAEARRQARQELAERAEGETVTVGDLLAAGLVRVPDTETDDQEATE